MNCEITQLQHASAKRADTFLNAQQAAAALNLPLYFFVNTYKRQALGIPFYSINRLVRYRLDELHRWQVGMSASLASAPEQRAPHTGFPGSAEEGAVHA
jgi:hypothetical protein